MATQEPKENGTGTRQVGLMSTSPLQRGQKFETRLGEKCESCSGKGKVIAHIVEINCDDDGLRSRMRAMA